MKNKLSGFIVNHRRTLFFITLAAAVLCFFLMFRVPVNTDMTVYLPDSSRMKQGVDIMAEEFSDLSMGGTIRVMFKDVPEDEKESLADELREIEHVTMVTHSNGEQGEKDGWSLYTLTMDCDYGSEGEKAIMKTLDTEFNRYDMTYADDDTSSGKIPWWIIAIALAIILGILIFMSSSWVEPFLFVAAIGLAVLINMGTNIFLGQISDTSYSIAALLQLVLSMDYSVILMSRYRQEIRDARNRRAAESPSGTASDGAAHEDAAFREEAMRRAVYGAFSSIASSSFTTVVGLLVLIFMSFKLGGEVGIVLAKGVAISMVCVFTVLPALILRFDSLIRRTAKKVYLPRCGGLARFEYRARTGITVLFAALFVIMTILKSGADISFTITEPSAVDEIFPKTNQTVVLYENSDEEKMAHVLDEIQTDPCVISVTSGLESSDDTSDNALASLLRGVVNQAVKSQLTGENHSIAIITADLPDEGDETYAFLEKLQKLCDTELDGESYLIGNSVMAWEMSQTFGDELTRMTFLTAAAIFLVVLITFRSVPIPVILVLLIQTSVYATMFIMDLQGESMYYMALLMVQSILMGATIDYAIVFTACYREQRRKLDILPALEQSYERSLTTVLTSGLIIVLATWVLSYAFPNPAIGEICSTISMGAACAILLILFVLPGVLAALDRWVTEKPRRKKKQAGESS